MSARKYDPETGVDPEVGLDVEEFARRGHGGGDPHTSDSHAPRPAQSAPAEPSHADVSREEEDALTEAWAIDFVMRCCWSHENVAALNSARREKSLRQQADERHKLVAELLERLRARTQPQEQGERIVGFVDAEALEWFRDQKSREYMTSLDVWTYEGPEASIPATLTLRRPPATDPRSET